MSRISKSIEIESILVISKGWGEEGNGESLLNGTRAILGMIKMFQNWVVDRRRFDRDEGMRGNSTSKGPEVEVFLSCVRNGEEARVARAE